LLRIKGHIWAKLLIVGGVVALLGLVVGHLSDGIGQADFRAYWSASYLLAQGEDFADDEMLLSVQRDTGFHRDYVMKTWNPPWILLWLIPYTWVAFDTAAKLWLLTNIGVLFFSMVIGWRLQFRTGELRKGWVWLPLLAAVLFPSTIVALLFGQVNLVVLGGLVGFLFFSTRQQEEAAGLALVLTTFKPHLVYLALPIILLHLIWQRRWRTLLVFGGLLAGSMMVVLYLRPTFLSDYLQGTTAGNLFAWETATFVTYVSLQMGWPWVRLIGIGLLPLAVAAWFYNKERLPLLLFVEIAVLISVITMPFGWSYDFVLLLLPMLRVFMWLAVGQWPLQERLALLLVLIITYLLYYQQRVVTPSELYFFWVPLVLTAVYGWVIWRQGYTMHKGGSEKANV
jgi:hypothetical protein